MLRGEVVCEKLNVVCVLCVCVGVCECVRECARACVCVRASECFLCVWWIRGHNTFLKIFGEAMPVSFIGLAYCRFESIMLFIMLNFRFF